MINFQGDGEAMGPVACSTPPWAPNCPCGWRLGCLLPPSLVIQITKYRPRPTLGIFQSILCNWNWFDSSDNDRQNILHKIITLYKPLCNSDDIVKEKPTYTVRKSENISNAQKFSCPCCGTEMKPEKVLEKSTLYRCTNCGLSDTKLDS